MINVKKYKTEASMSYGKNCGVHKLERLPEHGDRICAISNSILRCDSPVTHKAEVNVHMGHMNLYSSTKRIRFYCEEHAREIERMIK